MGVLKVRVGDLWEVVGGGDSEVVVGNVDPYVLDPAAKEELWFNTMVRQLFVRVNGSWRVAVDDEVVVSQVDPAPLNLGTELWYDIDAAGPGVASERYPDEVHVASYDPLLVNPTAELWHDTGVVPHVLKAKVDGIWEEVAAPSAPPELPPGGAVNQALTKVDATDGNTRWGGNLDVNGIVQMQPNATGPKINLYSTTFGIGVESGETSIYASSKVGFHANASNGTKWAEIDANGLGPRTNTNVSWQNGFTGSAQFRVNPAVVTLALWEFTNGVELYSFNPVKMFDYPAGVPAPWANCSGAVMPVWMGSTYGYLPLRVDCRTDGVFMYAADYFQPGDLWECACTITWAR